MPSKLHFGLDELNQLLGSERRRALAVHKERRCLPDPERVDIAPILPQHNRDFGRCRVLARSLEARVAIQDPLGLRGKKSTGMKRSCRRAASMIPAA